MMTVEKKREALTASSRITWLEKWMSVSFVILRMKRDAWEKRRMDSLVLLSTSLDSWVKMLNETFQLCQWQSLKVAINDLTWLRWWLNDDSTCLACWGEGRTLLWRWQQLFMQCSLNISLFCVRRGEERRLGDDPWTMFFTFRFVSSLSSNGKCL